MQYQIYKATLLMYNLESGTTQSKLISVGLATVIIIADHEHIRISVGLVQGPLLDGTAAEIYETVHQHRLVDIIAVHKIPLFITVTVIL